MTQSELQKYLESALAQAFPLPTGVETTLVISQDMSGRYQTDISYTAPEGSVAQMVTHLWMGARFGVDLDDLANKTISAFLDANSIRPYESMLTQSVSAAQQAFVNGTGSQEALIAAQRGVLALAAQSRTQRQAVFDAEQKRQGDLATQKAASAALETEKAQQQLLEDQRRQTEQAALATPPCCGLVAVGGPVTTPAGLVARPGEQYNVPIPIGGQPVRETLSVGGTVAPASFISPAAAQAAAGAAPGPAAVMNGGAATTPSTFPWWILVLVVFVLLLGGAILTLRR